MPGMNTSRSDWAAQPHYGARRDGGGVAAAHEGSWLPACSATMHSAYQAGQPTVSCLPVRFSCSPCAAAARRACELG